MESIYFFPRERTSGNQVFPSPRDHEVVGENPPPLIWLAPEGIKDPAFCVTVWDKERKPVYTAKTASNAAAPTAPFPVGEYTWDVEETKSGIRRGESSFVIPASAPVIARPDASEVLDGIPDERPRHLFRAADREELIRDNPAAVETLRRNIKQAYLDGMPERPMFHKDENALPYREYFGRFRDFCDRDLVACALGYSLLGDEEAGNFAKKLFFTICDWNPAGPCSLLGPWGDEVGLSCARCFPAVFDMLYPLMSEKERIYAAETVAAYAYQCERRLKTLDYPANPGDNHAGRLPAYLGEAAIALWGTGYEEETLRRWLSYALSIYNGMFPFYGTSDGAWAQGTFYSTSYTKWYLPFFSAVRRFGRCGWLDRPFYRHYARFLLHFALPDHEVYPFCDGLWCKPESPEWPGFFAQNPFRVYAAASGLPEAMDYEKKLSDRKLFELHLLDVFLPHTAEQKSPVEPVTDADAFPESGFVSLHSDRTDLSHDLHLMARASKFGPGSHRQPDNGAFALFYGGTALLSPSGYFGREYGSKHHMGWFNTTKAHNAILIDGVGQDYHDFRHTGEILSCTNDNGVRKAVLDLTASYPMLQKWIRTLRVESAERVVIEDEILADHPVKVTYLLHSLSPITSENDRLTVHRNGVTLQILPEKPFEKVTLSDRYDVDLNEGQPKEYHVTMPPQFHAYLDTGKACAHHLSVAYQVEHK